MTTRRAFSQPIQVQINVRIHAPRNGRRIPESLIREAILHKANTGEDVPGMEIRIVNWQHGSGPVKRADADQANIWRDFAVWLQSERAGFTVSATYYQAATLRSR